MQCFYCLAGGPLPPGGLLRKSGRMLKTRAFRKGGPKVHHHLRARAGESADGDLVHMYRDSTIAPILNQRRGLQSVPTCYSGNPCFWILSISRAGALSAMEQGYHSGASWSLSSVTLALNLFVILLPTSCQYLIPLLTEETTQFVIGRIG